VAAGTLLGHAKNDEESRAIRELLVSTAHPQVRAKMEAAVAC